jgi:hypothetical protein
MLKTLMCKLNLRHVWHIETTEDGSSRIGAARVAVNTTAAGTGLASCTEQAPSICPIIGRVDALSRGLEHPGQPL